MKPTSKLYVIVRRNMSAGYQAAQACHALRQFVFEHPVTDSEWFRTSNRIVLLSVPNEIELMRYVVAAEDLNIRWSLFREPDLNGSLTSVSLEPSEESEKLVSGLPLALSEFNSC